jgi:hypothetical protein
MEEAIRAKSITARPLQHKDSRKALPKLQYLEGEYNTNINISVGALVDSCVYGGGYGIQATVTGTTGVNLLGGTVELSIFMAAARTDMS